MKQVVKQWMKIRSVCQSNNNLFKELITIMAKFSRKDVSINCLLFSNFCRSAIFVLKAQTPWGLLGHQQQQQPQLGGEKSPNEPAPLFFLLNNLLLFFLNQSFHFKKPQMWANFCHSTYLFSCNLFIIKRCNWTVERRGIKVEDITQF